MMQEPMMLQQGLEDLMDQSGMRSSTSMALTAASKSQLIFAVSFLAFWFSGVVLAYIRDLLNNLLEMNLCSLIMIAYAMVNDFSLSTWTFGWFWMLTAQITLCFSISLCILFLSLHWKMKSWSYHIYEILSICSAYNWSLTLGWTVSYASFFFTSIGSELFCILVPSFSWKHFGEVRICLILQ